MVTNVVQLTQHNESTQGLIDTLNEQQNAFRHNPLPSAKERIDQLKRLKKALLNHQENIINAIHEDFDGRSSDETLMAEIMTSLEYIKQDIRHVKHWMRPKRRSVGLAFLPATAKIFYQPVGVVGIIAPWNYPIVLALGPLVSALAAGNRVMLKLSEYTPKTSEVTKAMLKEVFPNNQVAVITGGPEVGVEFSQLPFNHLFFTGSTTVGRHVMKAAAENLTPVTLELGGKSPAIATNNMPIKETAKRICFGKSFNAGQTCIAPDYVLCPTEQKDAFIQAYEDAFNSMYKDLKHNPHYTSIVNEKQYQRLHSYLDDAKNKGAHVKEINPKSEDFSDSSRKMPIYLVTDVNDDMQVMQEEIFGPILPIVTYDALDDAIEYINKRPRPLALYFFSYDKKQQQNILQHTHAGGVCINDSLSHFAQADLPFGGIGPSGMGTCHGKEGFLTFSHAKSVMSKSRFNSSQLAYPPYGKMNKLIYKLFIR